MTDDYDVLLDSLSTPKLKGPKTRPAIDFRQLYNDVGTKHGVDPDLLYNQAKHESINFNPNFVFGPGRSPKGAAGIAQFMPDTARKYGLYVGKGRDDRFNPEKAADAHARLMKDLIDKYGDNRLALAAYNAGTGFTPQQARRAMQNIPETRNYVQKIAPQGDQYDQLLDNVSQQSPKPTTSSYDTKLSPQEERQFQIWKQQYAPKDSGGDYDLRGAFKAGLKPDPRTGHWPDTFKKPNHPTFSNESQYAVGADAAKAGHWEGDKFIPPNQGDEYDDLLDSIAPLKTPKVSVKLGEGAEMASPEEIAASKNPFYPKVKPVEFKEGSGLRTPQGALELATTASQTQQPRDTDRPGTAVRIPFNPKTIRPQDVTDEVERQIVKSLGASYEQLNEKHRTETQAKYGRPYNLVTLPPEEIRALKPEADGSVSVGISKGATDYINAYTKGGLPAAELLRAPSVQAHTPSLSEKIGEKGQELKQFLNLDTPAGIKTDLPRGVASAVTLGAIGDPREISPEEKLIDPNAQATANLARGTGEVAGALIPFAAAGKILAPLELSQSVQTAAQFGLVDAGRQLVNEAKGRPVDLKSPIVSAGLGAVIGQLEGADPSIIRKVVAFVTPQLALDAASGTSKEQAIQNALTNTAFALGTHQRGGEAERLTELGIERAPVAGVPGEATANIEGQLAEREAKVQPTFLRDDQGKPVARVLNPEEVAQGEKPKVRAIHHSDTQVRDESGKFAESATPEPAPEEVIRPPETATSPAEQPLEAAQSAKTPTAIPPTVKNAPMAAAAPETPPPPSTTSARKAQLAQDRAELDLPDLPQPERRSWKNALIEAQDEGLDKKANAIADGVIRQPRPLTDKETAGLTLRLQQIKNEHAAAMEAVDAAKGDDLAEARAQVTDLEAEFDKLSDAVKQSGTEKGRALASQKLTVNQDFDLVSMLNRYKVKTGKEPTPEIRAQIESQQRRIADLEKQLAERSAKGGIDRIAREVRRENRQRTRKVLDEEAATIKTNLAAEFARIKSQQGIQPSGLAGLDPEGVITKLALKYAKNRFEAGLTDAAQLVDDVHGVLSEFTDVTKRQVSEMISGYKLPQQPETKEQLEKTLTGLRKEMRESLRQADIDAGKISVRPEGPKRSEARRSGIPLQGPRLSEGVGMKEGPPLGARQGPGLREGAGKPEGPELGAKQGPKLREGFRQTEGPRLSEGVGKREGPKITDAPKVGPKETKAQIQSRYQKQISEIERRIREQDFAPKPKRGPTVLDSDTQKIQVNLERAKQDFQRQLRKWEASQRSPAEKTADLIVQWGRAAKLMYVSTLGKLTSAATGRMVMSPLENLVGEIPHRLSPELSKRATTEGGGFDKAAEVAALWKSGRFRQVLDQLTKGGSDLDVLFGGKKSIDKEMSSGGVLGIPGRVHGAMKEYPRQAEFDRAFVKVLRNYNREGRDITRPDVQLAAKMEAFNSAERARFQQRNFISDTFNSAMSALERKGMAGKATAKAGRFIFPITRVPVNVAGETLNYTFGIPRAAIETAIRGGVKNLTPEQANNIMRAYKKGGVGLAVMAYAFLHPQQFGGYYQKGEKRDPNEPQTGEVMFFGKRIPKVLTHVPILEAAQLAATVRRVMDRAAEQGKTDSAIEGGLAASKGLAEQIPFYETPARFFTGQEGSRGVAQGAGELARGMIPGFIQESAKFTDKDAQGNPIPRSPQGSFAQRFGQTVEMGVPGLRQRVPVNERLANQAKKAQLLQDYRSGKITKSDLDERVQWGELTKSEVQAITKQGEMTPRQAVFSNARPMDALDRYERMSDAQKAEVQQIMERHAWTLTHSDSLTEAQKQKYQERLDTLGVAPAPPRKRSSSPFSRRFLSAP